MRAAGPPAAPRSDGVGPTRASGSVVGGSSSAGSATSRASSQPRHARRALPIAQVLLRAILDELRLQLLEHRAGAGVVALGGDLGHAPRQRLDLARDGQLLVGAHRRVVGHARVVPQVPERQRRLQARLLERLLGGAHVGADLPEDRQAQRQDAGDDRLGAPAVDAERRIGKHARRAHVGGGDGNGRARHRLVGPDVGHATQRLVEAKPRRRGTRHRAPADQRRRDGTHTSQVCHAPGGGKIKSS